MPNAADFAALTSVSGMTSPDEQDAEKLGEISITPTICAVLADGLRLAWSWH